MAMHRSSAKARTWVYFPFCWLGSHRPGAGPGGAGVVRRCLLVAPAAKTKHGLHTTPELWDALGVPGRGLGCLCHSGVAPCSNSLTASPILRRAETAAGG
jgi:hypothetical protein